MTLYKPRAWLRSIGQPAPTLASLWDYLGALYGERPFVHLRQAIWGDYGEHTTLTYREVQELVARWAGELVRRGIQPGQRVAIVAANRFEYALAFFAVVRLGAVAVPLHHQVTADELRARCEQGEARWLLTDRNVRIASPTGGISLREVARWAPAASAASPAAIEPQQVCAILFTSGTTGRPKGAQLTSRGLMSLRRLLEWAPNPTPEVALYALPTAHMMGLSTVLYVAFAGCSLIWRERFDAHDVLQVIEQQRPTFFVGVPAMYGMLLEAGAEDRDLSSIRFWVSSADAMPANWVERFVRLGRALPSPGATRLCGSGFAEMYGMVELAGAALAKITLPPLLPPSSSREQLGRGRLRHAAVPVPPYRLRVVDDAGRDVAAGSVGELWLRGPGVTRGYDQDPQGSRDALAGDWLRTGDLVRKHWWGGVSFAGRKKEVIKHGGYSVFPAQVEAELLRHPQVREAVVFGVAHPTRGEVPAAVVTLRAGATLSESELHSWARQRMTPYMSPRAVLITQEPLPHNANEKLQRREARERWTSELRERFPAAFAP